MEGKSKMPGNLDHDASTEEEAWLALPPLWHSGVGSFGYGPTSLQVAGSMLWWGSCQASQTPLI